MPSCYAVGAKRALLYAALRARFCRGQGFIPNPYHGAPEGAIFLSLHTVIDFAEAGFKDRFDGLKVGALLLGGGGGALGKLGGV